MMPTWKDVAPRQKQPKMRATPEGNIGLREHLRNLLDQPDMFQGGIDLNITLPADTYLRVLKATINSQHDNLTAWIIETIDQQARQEHPDGR